jgi:CheY-like chemotaxis protein
MNVRSRILIIDDDLAVRLRRRDLRAQAGDFDVDECADGTTGLTRAAEFRPDLVLLKIRMPGMSGFEVCTRLRATPANRDVPVIVPVPSGADRVIGIASKQHEKLFQPFEQHDASVVRAHGGTGLRLALVQRILHLHGGTIAIRSVLGQGSSFTGRLPAACVPPAAEPGRPLRAVGADRGARSAGAEAARRFLPAARFCGARSGAARRGARGRGDGHARTVGGRPGLPDPGGPGLIARLRAQPAGVDAHLSKPASLPPMSQSTYAVAALTA